MWYRKKGSTKNSEYINVSTAIKKLYRLSLNSKNWNMHVTYKTLTKQKKQFV